MGALYAMNEPAVVLHIDDDALFRRAVRRSFERSGVSVIEAMHGEEGMRHALADAPDVILLDIKMPIQDGFETLRLLSRHEQTKSIPVVMCSSFGTKEDIAFCFHAGAKGYLIKGHHHLEEIVRYVRGMMKEG